MSGDTKSLWDITSDSRYDADVLANRGKIDPREACAELQLTKKKKSFLNILKVRAERERITPIAGEFCRRVLH